MATSADGSNPIEAVAAQKAPTIPVLIVFVLVIAVVASLLEPVLFGLTRVFEGQSRLTGFRRTSFVAQRADLDARRSAADATIDRLDARLVALRARRRPPTRGIATCIRERAELDVETERLSLQLERWPESDERVVSTRLGNIIRSYEDRANRLLREWSDPAVPASAGLEDLLPFAYHAIPKETRDQHDRFRSQLQAGLALVVVLPLVGAGLVAVDDGLWWRAGIIVATSTLALAAHIGARSSADGYGTMLLAIARQYVLGLYAGIEPVQHDEVAAIA